MPGEFLLPFGLGQIGPDAGGERGALDQAGDVLVGQPVGADLFAVRNGAEQRPVADAGKAEPGFQRRNRAGGVAGAAADLDLAPAGLAAHLDDDALVQELDPAGARPTV